MLSHTPSAVSENYAEDIAVGEALPQLDAPENGLVYDSLDYVVAPLAADGEDELAQGVTWETPLVETPVNTGPEGTRFCTGCRGFRKEEEFEPSRKMCSRHKKNKAANTSPTIISSIQELTSVLSRRSAEDGVSKFDASCLLDELPGQDEVHKEIGTPAKGDGEVDETAEGMRRARARCRPLINLIHEATGYSFVYKDCRSGRKLKYSHSLRYLCAQRTDQDGAKRRAAAAEAIKNELEKGQDAITSATIAAVMEGTKDYDESNMNAVAGPSNAIDVEGGGHEEEDMSLDIDPNIQQDLEQVAGDGAKEGEGKEVKQSNKGKGKGWRKGTGKPKPEKSTTRKKNVAHKVRMPARKMERYDCRGSVVINIHHDDKTAYFTVTHALKHPDYVDVVGNRLRGARFIPEPLEIVSSILPPVGSIEYEGATPIEKLERTLEGMAALVKDLKTYRGGGEQEIAQQMYDSTVELRRLRTATAEVLAKATNKKPNSGAKATIKRAISEVDGATEEDGRNANAVASGSRLDQQIDQQLQQHLQFELQSDRRLHQQILGLDPLLPFSNQLDASNPIGSNSGIAGLVAATGGVGGAEEIVDEFSTGYVAGPTWLDPALER